MSSTRITRSSKRALVMEEMDTLAHLVQSKKACEARQKKAADLLPDADLQLLEKPIAQVVTGVPTSSSSSDTDQSGSNNDSRDSDSDSDSSNSDSRVIAPPVMPVSDSDDGSASEPKTVGGDEKKAAKGKKARLLQKIKAIHALMMKGEHDKALQIVSLIIESNMINVEKKTRSPTKYNLFLKERLTEVRKSNPGLPQREIMKICAKEWKDKKVAIGAAVGA
jgi:hypothetical protein